MHSASQGPIDVPVVPPGAANIELLTLVARIAKRDPAALEALYDVTSAVVYGLALRILGKHESAEEVTLDVYTQVWENAAEYSQGRGTVCAWLFTMARSRAIDRLRSTRRRREVAMDNLGHERPDRSAPPEELCLASERGATVRNALSSLPQSQRRAIELAFFEGLTHRDIAERLNLALGTVKTQIRLGILKLRNILGHPSTVERGVNS